MNIDRARELDDAKRIEEIEGGIYSPPVTNAEQNRNK